MRSSVNPTTSQICIGGGSFIERFTQSEMELFCDAALDLKINTLDLAPTYGLCEENFGRVASLSNFAISSKVSNPGINTQTPNEMRDSIHKSLKVLNIGQLDTVYIHSASFKSINEDHFEMFSLMKEMGDFVHLGYSGDNEDLAWFEKHPLVTRLMCSINLVDLANWPIVKNTDKPIVVKRPLANRVWRPTIRQKINELRMGSRFRPSEYQLRFECLYGERRVFASDSFYLARSLEILKGLKVGTRFAVGTSSIKNLRRLRILEMSVTGSKNLDNLYDGTSEFANGEYKGLL